MTDDVIYRSADGFGKSLVIKGRRNRAIIQNEVMADLVEFGCADAGLNKFTNHFKYFASQFAGCAHFFLGCWFFYGNASG